LTRHVTVRPQRPGSTIARAWPWLASRDEGGARLAYMWVSSSRSNHGTTIVTVNLTLEHAPSTGPVAPYIPARTPRLPCPLPTPTLRWWGPRGHHNDFAYARHRTARCTHVLSSHAVKQFIRNVRAAKTIADERAVVQKESAAIRASFREESHDSDVRCVAWPRCGVAHADRATGGTMSPSSSTSSPSASGPTLGRSSV